MIGPSSFDQVLYNQLKLISSVQREIGNINNIEEIGNVILKNKEIIEKESGILILAQCFYDMADFHPKDIEKLCDLFIFLQNSQSASNYIHLLKDHIVSFLLTKERIQSSFLFFLRTLLIKNVITLDSIIHQIQLMPPFSSNIAKNKLCDIKNNQISNESNENVQYELMNKAQPFYFMRQKIFRVINWFYPEIKAHKIELIEKVKNNLLYKEPIEFKQFNAEEILEIMNSGYCNDEIARIIRNDDIESFNSIVSKSGKNFDYNQTVKTTVFERCSLISHEPTIIQYASFFNSVKIFKYLLSNKADIKILNHGIFSLDHFAIAGGSVEIIRILEQNNFKFESGILFSIKYFRNDILIWLLDNFKPKSSDDFSSMNFNKNNHNKFFDHQYIGEEEIEEYDDDYYHPKNKYHLPNGLENKLNEEEDENESENIENSNANLFEFYDLDLIFDTILTSNNLLALFILFNHGLSINERCKASKKTLLHFAIQKGKLFVFDLLLSNKNINLLLKDSQGQLPIVYTIKYTREKMFFKMIQNQTFLDSLTDQDYIQMIHYSIFCGMKNVLNYLDNNWKLDLLNLFETDEIKCFCDALSFLPLSYFDDQIKPVLIESFQSRKFHYFCILANRLLTENSLNLNCKFYFVNLNKKNSVTFGELSLLLSFYYILDKKNVNFYAKYKNKLKNDGNVILDAPIINCYGEQVEEDMKFGISNGNNFVRLERSEYSKEPEISFVIQKVQENELYIQV